jgi:hypothetical protein
MSAIPERPAFIDSQNSPALFPKPEITPMPVITTLLIVLTIVRATLVVARSTYLINVTGGDKPPPYKIS